jgi:cell division protein FtsB
MPSKEPNNWKNFFLSRWFLLGALVVAVFIALAYGRAYYQDYQVRQEIKRLQEEVKKLEVKKLESLEMWKYVQSPAFVEEKAREELNLVKPGEHVAIVPNLGQAEAVRQEEEDMLKWYNLPNPLKWWKYFVEGAR